MELSTRVFNCCFQGDLAELEALLQQNSGDRELNVDLFTLENGQNALHSACMGTMNDPCGDKEGSKKIGKKLVKLLLDHGADINAQTARGHTPLMLAIRHNAQECMQQLLASRANVHLHDLADKDALFFALQYNSKPRLSASSSGDPATPFMLLSCGVSVNPEDRSFVSDFVVQRELEQQICDYRYVQGFIDEYHAKLNPVLSEHVEVDRRVGLGQNGLYQEPLERVMEYLGFSMVKNQVVNASIDGEDVRRVLIPGNALIAKHFYQAWEASFCL